HRAAVSFALAVGVGELLRGAPPDGEVARHLAEADQRAGGVAQGRDDAVRPEALAVLAQAPPFILHPALAHRRIQLRLWFAARQVFRRVKHRTVLTPDLFRGVSLDRLGARGPPRHSARPAA